ncbi:MAG: helix-turn-helix domain-containing protein [Proteobacteria bacterium]|nr:helix-turn-helix domain-containing protein [Pseudomonadota bacterium]
MAEPSRLEELREQCGLTQRALGARVLTTRQQIERLELGEEPSPQLAFALAWALAVPLRAIFPKLASLHDLNSSDVYLDGDEVRAIDGLPTWQLELCLQDLSEPLYYDVDSTDAHRIAKAFRGAVSEKFLYFESDGRMIYVNNNYVQSLRIFEERTALCPELSASMGGLHPRTPN